MALVKGTVSVSAAGVVAGAGLARDLYDAEVASYPGFGGDTSAQGILAKQAVAAKCGAWADKIDAYIKSATVTVTCPPGGGVVVGVVT